MTEGLRGSAVYDSAWRRERRGDEETRRGEKRE